MTTNATYSATITAAVPDFAEDTIDFKLLSSVAIATLEIFPGKVYTMTLDASGVGSTDLPTPDGTGDLAWLWEVNLPDGREVNISFAWAATSQDLATLLTAAQSSTTPSDIAQLIANKQDKDATAEAGDMAFFDGDGNTVDAGFQMSWNDDDKTVDIPLNDNVTLQTGQEVVVYARNNSGSTITNGSIVRFSGSTGTRDTVELAQADTVENARQIGMATEDIANGADGFVTIIGLVRGQDTSMWDEEDILYLSTSSAGEKTSTEPVYPDILVEVGLVIRKHPTDGIVFVSSYETASGAYLKASSAAASKQDKDTDATDGNLAIFVGGETVDGGGKPLYQLSDVIIVDAGGNGDYTTLSECIADDTRTKNTVYVYGVTNEGAAAIEIPSGMYVWVTANSRVTSNGSTILSPISLADSSASFLVMGQRSSGNISSGDYAGVALGGDGKSATGTCSGVGSGGYQNSASTSYSGVGSGGYQNSASGLYSGVGSGGQNNNSSGNHAGVIPGSRRSKATHRGAKLSSDSSNYDFDSITDDEFAVRATGGVRLITSIDGSGNPSATFTINGIDGNAGTMATKDAADYYLKTDLSVFSPPQLADSAAANNTIYYSTTSSKLVYKDPGGVVNNLY